MWTISDSGKYILFDNGLNQIKARKSYLSMIADGDIVHFYWHNLETGVTFSRRELSIDYNDVTSPAVSSANDLVNYIEGLITLTVTDWGDIGGTLSNQTDLQSALNAKQSTSEKNQPSGYAGLDSSSKLNGAHQVYGTTANTACEGNDVRLSDARTPTAHASSHVNGTDDIQIANASQKGLLSAADWTTFNNKQNALGYTPLNPANNLSDVSNAATSRTNLGATTVGSNIFTATNPSAVRWIRVNADNSITFRSAAETLSDIGAQASGSYLTSSNNLSDVSNRVTSLNNLGIQVAVTTSDYTNNTASFTNVTGASFSVDSSSTYYFEISGGMTSGNASGLRLGLSVPSGSTVVYEIHANNNSATAFTSRSESYSGGEIVLTIAPVATTRLGFRIFGTITTGSSGTVQLQGRIAGSSYTITLHSGLRIIAFKK